MKALFPFDATTRDVTVRVAASFLADQSDPAKGKYFWAYHVRIENGGAQAVQLMARRWLIVDAHGARHRVEGEGVVGEQPVIAPGGAYDYVSGCPLVTPTGSMQGAYHMIAEDGTSFEAAIPRFVLTAPVTAG